MNPYVSRIQKVIDEIEGRLGDPITVREMAEKSKMSIWEFQRIFSGIVGETIGGYIRNRRLTLCARELKETDRKILDIAVDYQFGSQEAFSRAFKGYYGKTPKQARKDPAKIDIRAKPHLTPELLEHVKSGIQLEPKIVERPLTRLVGMERTTPSHLGDYHDYDKILVPFWKKFLERKREIQNAKRGFSIGLMRSEARQNEEETLLYLAAAEVTEFSGLPQGMKKIEIPPTRYAVFTNKGTGDKTPYTSNYIYGTWLIRSKFKRASGDDFEVFDDRYTILDDSSESDYYLPIE